ncbi:MAG: ribonuclease E/G [Lachnospiraceae bacterium]
MNRLVIKKQANTILTYDCQDDMLVTVQAETIGTSILGNIYVGKIQNIVSNIKAAFVEIQQNVICYLSLSDCTEPIVCNRTYQGKLIIGDEVLVQVIRDKAKTKEATVSTKLSLSGHYSVVSYPNRKIGFSNKLSAIQRTSLKERITSLSWNHAYGYIIRTNAAEFADATVDITPLQSEIEQLTFQLDQIIKTAPTRPPFSTLYCAPEKYLNLLKNTYRNRLDKIITDDETIYTQVESYLQENQPEDVDKLSFYQDSMISLEKMLRLDKKLQDALHTHVWLKSGGYLVIEPTEALTVIDVNTGKYSAKQDSEATFLAINLEAAAEIAHQIRLRNLSGIILVDFINMEQSKQDELLLTTLRNHVKQDPIKTNVIDITALGLVEITRKKIEPPLCEQLSGILE